MVANGKKVACFNANANHRQTHRHTRQSERAKFEKLKRHLLVQTTQTRQRSNSSNNSNRNNDRNSNISNKKNTLERFARFARSSVRFARSFVSSLAIRSLVRRRSHLSEFTKSLFSPFFEVARLVRKLECDIFWRLEKKREKEKQECKKHVYFPSME